MSKPYSNKALPPGTVLREWRLEDVLGVGGFGIVYRGRGIYFGELVAIKEYFPSAIAERDAEDTVVPIGSDVEEVHALGLKKFVEEAKLLWNLSTPTRHPNIVSVRSLFEIHGTAYMVMDFEDGVSLSKMLKEGRRFNERSLWSIIKPVAEGLDRAHRVGVLHRDIKPPNILITDDSRPVLIDFGSARFEAAEATSTSVTFHTPPYAAVEQYVKTYAQGPWTDVYALAVVLYECVTGEKPPEVLERMHGGLGSPLADGHWPGFSKKFLQAIDKGMTIRPSERPQSIGEWLAMFGKKDVDLPIESDDEPTRFFAHEVATDEIVPVAAVATGFDKTDLPETGVPSDPKEAQFKKAGQETKASQKKKTDAAAAAAAAGALAAANAAGDDPDVEAVETVQSDPIPDKPQPAVSMKASRLAKGDGEPWYRKQRAALFAGGGAIAALAAVAAGYMLSGKTDGGGYDVIPALVETAPEPVKLADVVGIAADERTLADEARKAGISADLVNPLVAVGEVLDKQLLDLRPLLDDPAQADAANQRGEEMKRTAMTANANFANALLSDAEGRANRAPSTADGSSMAGMRAALDNLRAAVQSVAGAANPAQSIAATRDALAKSQQFAATIPATTRVEVAEKRPPVASLTPMPPQPRTTQAQSPQAATASTPPSTAAAVLPSANKAAQVRSVVASARSRAKQVIAMGNGGGDVRKANAKLARNYDRYLASIADSMRGARTDRELDQLLKQANQTKAYVDFLYKQSSQGN
ncbi:serine/threonine protein kinase [Sphingomonas edaphi]|uniref:serine/threonine protein kinase n=1 Tax=Sphingomonas edaphi TaxID=2315689 RepID=UPI00131425A8|nr:serine/threonine-protein kinase [Sphingomonas edaphi]